MDVVERDVKTGGELTGKTRQRTEWNGGASLGRSRLVPGCSTNMMMIMVELIKAGTRL
jgi:hypothetical protein